MQYLTAVGSNLFVRATDGSGSQDLWMVNSSGAATQINTRPAGSDYPNYLTAVGEHNLFVRARDAAGISFSFSWLTPQERPRTWTSIR